MSINPLASLENYVPSRYDKTQLNIILLCTSLLYNLKLYHIYFEKKYFTIVPAFNQMENTICLTIYTYFSGNKEGMMKQQLVLLYLEWSWEVNFFCLLQTQSNEGDVGCFPINKTERQKIEITWSVISFSLSYTSICLNFAHKHTQRSNAGSTWHSRTSHTKGQYSAYLLYKQLIMRSWEANKYPPLVYRCINRL